MPGFVVTGVAFLIGAALAGLGTVVLVHTVNGSPEQSDDPLIVYGSES